MNTNASWFANTHLSRGVTISRARACTRQRRWRLPTAGPPSPGRRGPTIQSLISEYWVLFLGGWIRDIRKRMKRDQWSSPGINQLRRIRARPPNVVLLLRTAQCALCGKKNWARNICDRQCVAPRVHHCKQVKSRNNDFDESGRIPAARRSCRSTISELGNPTGKCETTSHAKGDTFSDTWSQCELLATLNAQSSVRYSESQPGILRGLQCALRIDLKIRISISKTRLESWFVI